MLGKELLENLILGHREGDFECMKLNRKVILPRVPVEVVRFEGFDVRTSAVVTLKNELLVGESNNKN